MNYPTDLTTLPNDMLIAGYAAAIKSPHEDNSDLEKMRDSVIAAHRQEIERRVESADNLGLLAIGQTILKYFPDSFDLPIRKKITYSPTGKKAPAWIGLFSRKNRGLAE